jgi:hypothetical protein
MHPLDIRKTIPCFLYGIVGSAYIWICPNNQLLCLLGNHTLVVLACLRINRLIDDCFTSDLIKLLHLAV